MRPRNALFFRYLLFALAVVGCDQISKQIALNYLYNESLAVFPGLQFILGFNYGAAFGFLHEAGGWQRYFLSAFAAIIAAVLLVWLWLSKRMILSFGLAAVVGGALGNLIDRLYYGYVIDFIVLHYKHWYFPTFNIADTAITLGAGLLILDSIKIEKNEK